MDDGDEPCRKSSAVLDLIDIHAQSTEVIGTQLVACVREDIHDVIIPVSVMADCGEQEPAICVEEEVPRALWLTTPQLRDPVIHD